ncbi:MAG: hypothetical protein IPG28_05670 [Betaproteobacteria bacterium]|nr:hypothetical protein [Betaproteobacteria bacterium]
MDEGPQFGRQELQRRDGAALLPAEAVYCPTAISDRALAYTEAELKHRFLVIYEAAGMMGELASYLIRSAVRGRIVYEMVERQASRPGATPHREGRTDRTHRDHHGGAAASGERNPALVAAGHRHPGADPEVVRAIAHSARADFDPALWISCSSGSRAGNTGWRFRFAPALAERIPPIAVRLRRTLANC